jgi:hypothetical protein
MKSPPVQYSDDEARKMVEDFISKYSTSSTSGKGKKKVSS